jgi:succinoglycan biosynthesis transport protein ExoP
MAFSESDRRDAYLPRIQVPALDMDGIAAMLRRRAAFIAAVTLACAGICLVWILLLAPKYAASGRILLDLPVVQAGGDGGPSTASGDADPIGVKNQIHVMTSRSVYDRVIAQEKLETDPLFGKKSKGILSSLLASVGLARAVDPHAMALRQLARAVSIEPNPGSHTVDVNVVTSDRDASARIANAVMDGYVEEQTNARGGASSSAAANLGTRLETLQSRLRNAEQRYEVFRIENRIVENSLADAEKKVKEVSGQMSAADAKVAGLRSTLGQLQRAKRILDAGGIPDTGRGGVVGSLGSRYAAAKELELDMSETLGPRHPDRVFARMRATEAKRLLDQSIQGAVQSTASELERARSSVTQLRSRLEASKQELTKSSETFARLKELERDVEASRAAYQAVAARSRDLGTASRSEGSNARILSRATAPLEPSGTFPIGVLLASLLIGLGLGVSLAWLLELMDEPKGPVIAP